MTGRIEKTVFISYRRANAPWAIAVYQDLTAHGYDAFYDFKTINSGNFEKIIIENIKARAHFLAILTPSALERCKEPKDWFRREIEAAMDEKRNIVPLMVEGFDFGSPIATQALSGKLGALSSYNGLGIYAEYFFEGMSKLRQRYLNVALEDVQLHSLSEEAKQSTETQKTIASQAKEVEQKELIAQKLFEQGNEFYDEYIRQSNP